MNDDKTEYIFLVSAKITAQPIRIGEATITPTPSARNIGVMVDKMLTMADHIKKVCQMCHLWLRNIRRIRPSLSSKTPACAKQRSQIDNLHTPLYTVLGHRADISCNPRISPRVLV